MGIKNKNSRIQREEFCALVVSRTCLHPSASKLSSILTSSHVSFFDPVPAPVPSCLIQSHPGKATSLRPQHWQHPIVLCFCQVAESSSSTGEKSPLFEDVQQNSISRFPGVLHSQGSSRGGSKS